MTPSASAHEVPLQTILPWRDRYRQEMNCQVIHDSIHFRSGWTREFALRLGETMVGYGSLAIAGPWKEKPTIYEFHVAPPWRDRVFDLFEALLAASGAVAIETQSNGRQLTVMLHAYAQNVFSESILFEDGAVVTQLPPPDGVIFRAATPDDAAQIAAQNLDTGATWLLAEVASRIVVATGGALFHYNRPYGDIYMAVAESHRRRGLGSYLVQEIKRTCYEDGHVSAARCNVTNVASRRTLQRAGFEPCGHILVGAIPTRPAVNETAAAQTPSDTVAS
jgi:GNAT superfamily N-acetyltransferase